MLNNQVEISEERYEELLESKEALAALQEEVLRFEGRVMALRAIADELLSK